VAEAIREATETKKTVIIDFSAPWSEWCLKMSKTTYRDPIVADLLKKFICIRIDPEKHPELVQKLNINGYPTTLFFCQEGMEIDRLPGYVEPAELADKLISVVDKCAAVVY